MIVIPLFFIARHLLLKIFPAFFASHCVQWVELFFCAALIVLACLAQDNARHSFGHSGGFVCPFVPFLPVACILVNTYLLVNLGAGTWFRVSIWLLIGALVYLFYGRTHSSLKNAVYVPTACADEIYRNSSDLL
ncbi:hypothetical protein OIU84_027525 [Salix udensis]|uniref:Cationic amino acid transporter C-terminal domain-containing protein n=1 Tax=Salix udensis TaxID=889485 RepID=A0AAD6KFJ5_9ROSI|nr:hypothetical protein OIU84_027525 [Salix udensis]